ncbi:hypothetical protein FJQ54_13605 [Sandaracinobacter neustonicus]|uniref:Platelet-activating factor acetylhydrolase n=1 Tax=Sandaracinobacter neustonicus TaxID=1715348 RepID=A0A501XG02_9SPHN|nr:hypothetical protein [Sandaracinobacter neustonicus]TPE59512.1 hypothetical protein FJQ54_13605 [Sandaracinobacter neustonicus]
MLVSDGLAWAAVAVATVAILHALIRHPRQYAWQAGLWGLSSILLLAALLSGGPRWQLVPLGLAALFCLTVAIVRWVRASKGKLQPRAGRFNARALLTGLIALPFIAVTGLALYLFPLFEMPRPSGRYPVGYTEFHWTDANRPELHTVSPIDKRALTVEVFYPADPGNREGKLRPVMLEGGAVGASLLNNLPGTRFFLSHLAGIPSNSRIGAKLASDHQSFPVVIFSHGLGVHPDLHLSLVEELASRGFVVFSVNHTYGSAANRFPDGELKLVEVQAYQGGEPPPNAQVTAEAERILASNDPAVIAEGMQRLMNARPLDRAIERFGLDIWEGDQRFVLDQLGQLQAGILPSQFKDRLDLDHTAVTGMSFGGIAAVATCGVDSRCKAVADLDGFFVDLLDRPAPQQPMLVLNGADNNMGLALFDRPGGWHYWMKVKDTRHADFSDIGLFSRLWRMKGSGGSIDAAHIRKIVNSSVSSFLEASLLSGKSDWKPPEHWNDVVFQSRGPAAASEAPASTTEKDAG